MQANVLNISLKKKNIKKTPVLGGSERKNPEIKDFFEDKKIVQFIKKHFVKMIHCLILT